jgi:PAS domain S-box-containing protein
MKPPLPLQLIAFVSAATFAGGPLAAFSPPAQLVVVTDDSYPPYLFRTDAGQLQGIIADKWELWSRKTGVPVRVEGMAWARAQESVQTGTADVIDALAYSAPRAALYELSPAYAPIEARVYFHRFITGIHDVASMRGFSIGAKEGSACGSWLAERGVNTLAGYPSSDALVKAAGAGEVRLFCMDSPTAQYFLFKLNLADEFRQTDPLYSTQFHWAVRKGRTELRDFIQRGFERIGADELQEIDGRWQGTPLRSPVGTRYWRYFAFLTAIVLGLAGLLIVWNRALSLRVAAKTAELRAALDSLQVQSDRIRNLYDNAPCGYHSLDKDGVFVEMNDTELKWLGYSRDEVIGKLKFIDLLAQVEQKKFRENFEKFKEQGATRDLEYELIRKGGTRMSVLMSASLIRDAHGNYLMSRATLYDVTEWNQAILALKESEERFGQVFRLSPDAIAVTSIEEGRVIEANEAFARIAGRAREAVIGRTTAELGFWQDWRERAAMLVLPTAEGGVRRYERTTRTPAGEERDMLVRATRIELQGRPVLLTMIQDLTEHRRAERLLGESEALVTKMIEASPEAITIASIEDGTFIAVNPAGERLGGYTREEMIGRSALAMEFWPDPEERQRLVADLQRDEVVHGREIRLRRKDGELRDILASAALIDFGGRKLMLFQGIDITDRKSAEKALREHEELLRELSAHHDAVREEERARIAREVHDEMGQALTALKMDMSLLGLGSGKGAPRVAAQVRELKRRVDDIIQLVRDVATALRPAALDLGILPGVEWLVEEFQKRSGIHCDVKFESGEIDLAEDRSIVLFRILQESLTNISRHANAHNVEISLRRSATLVRLEVRDDGQGFDVEAARKKKTFGLLGIRERAIMLHGELDITSWPGKGTRVSVSIPI